MAKKTKKAVNNKKKKSMKKSDWIALIAAVAVIAAAVATLLIWANHDGVIKVKNGVYQVKKNWIVADYGTETSKQYKKIGTAEAVAGYVLTDESQNSLIKYYKPEEAGTITSVSVGGSSRNYGAMADYMHSFVKAQYAAEVNDPVQITVAGRDAEYISYVMPGKADSSTPDTLIAMAYIAYDANHCAFIQINCAGTAPTAQDIKAAFQLFGNAIQLEDAK